MSLVVDIQKNLGDFRLDVQFEGNTETLALLGASGCGKSMTLKCIAGIETPDTGTVVLDGRVLFDSKTKVNLPPQKRKVGYLFQSYALFPNMTVAQNISMGIRRSSRQSETIAGYLKTFYLEGTEHLYPRQLSGGQQQRVALARILASEPEMLMLDEPFSALDSYLRWQLELELSQTLKQYNKTTLFVSHSRDEVYRICDTVCVIENGKSEPVVSVKKLFENPGTLASALLSGLKNHSAARRIDDTHVEALDWGMTLACNRNFPQDLRYVGIRAHYIQPGEGANAISCHIVRVIDDVFSTVAMLRPIDAPADSGRSLLRIEMPKAEWEALNAQSTLTVHVPPADVLLLS